MYVRSVAAIFAIALAACGTVFAAADPASDAPEQRFTGAFEEASSYEEVLKLWHDAGDVNAWIGARFQYDRARAVQLSETQRQKNGRLPVHVPSDFYAAPSGVCIDVARFAVETLRKIDPGAKASYVMIEFDPVSIDGNTLRRHWLVSFERDGRHYYFADSKRPGYIAGPYDGTGEFIAEYAQFRQRPIVSFREVETFERQNRTLAIRKSRDGER